MAKIIGFQLDNGDFKKVNKYIFSEVETVDSKIGEALKIHTVVNDITEDEFAFIVGDQIDKRFGTKAPEFFNKLMNVTLEIHKNKLFKEKLSGDKEINELLRKISKDENINDLIKQLIKKL